MNPVKGKLPKCQKCGKLFRNPPSRQQHAERPKVCPGCRREERTARGVDIFGYPFSTPKKEGQ